MFHAGAKSNGQGVITCCLFHQYDGIDDENVLRGVSSPGLLR